MSRFLLITAAVLSGAAALLAADFSQIERSLKWSQPQLVTNDFGRVRLLRTAQPAEVFWQSWRTNKSAMRAAGFSARPTTNGWKALYWKEVK